MSKKIWYLAYLHKKKVPVTCGTIINLDSFEFEPLGIQDNLYFNQVVDVNAENYSQIMTRRDMDTQCTRILSELDKVTYSNIDYECSVKN